VSTIKRDFILTFKIRVAIMFTARLNTKELCIVSIKCTYVFCVITKINRLQMV